MNEASSFRKDDVLAGARRSLGDCRSAVGCKTILGLSAKQLFCDETPRSTIVHSPSDKIPHLVFR
jgi:hypothetical protein